MTETQDSGTLDGKYLTFHLGDEEYGISILKIREIIGMMPITSMPQAPEYIKGVINLRGKVIPILDLRMRFGMEEGEQTDRTCIIVVETSDGRGQSRLTGIVVDAVSEVQNIRAGDIEPPPAFGAALDSSCILGMAKAAGSVKILLDIEAVLNAEEIAAVAACM